MSIRVSRVRRIGPRFIPLALIVVLGTPPLVLAQAPAPGQPYTGNCPAELDAAVRLSRGLDGLDDSIARTERQLADAKQGRAASEAAKKPAEARRDLPVDIALILSKADEFSAALKASPLSPALRLGIENRLAEIRTGYALLAKLPAARLELSRAEFATLGQKVSALSRFVADSGFSEVLVGEAGGVVLATGVLAIDTIYASETAFQDALDQKYAADTLNALKQQKSLIMERIQNVVDLCGPKTSPAVQDSPRPIPPAASPAPPAQSEQPSKGGFSGPGAAAVILLGVGGAAAVVVGLKAISNANGGNNANCSTPAVNPIDVCGRPGQQSQCSASLAAYTTYCQCLGYAGFNSGAGSCQ